MERQAALELLSPVAAEQAGMVTSRQAGRVGVGPMMLVDLATHGSLRRLRRGVYMTAIGRAAHPHEDLIASWLAIDGAVLPWQRAESAHGIISHASAASLHGLGTILPALPDITTQRQSGHRADIHLHTARFRLEDWDWMDVADTRIPVTTPARTIIDLLIDHEEFDYLLRALPQAYPDMSTAEQELRAAASRRRQRTQSLVQAVDELIAHADFVRV